jgi:hypothetical protein
MKSSSTKVFQPDPGDPCLNWNSTITPMRFFVACLPGSIRGEPYYACGAVARYDHVIVRIYGNVFEGRWLQMEDFRRILENVDQRAVPFLE